MAKSMSDRLAEELAKALPAEVVDTVYDTVGKIADAFNKVDEVIIKAKDSIDERQDFPSIYDDVRNETPNGSAAPQEQPDAESGGTSLDSVLNTVYTYMNSNNLLKNSTVLTTIGKAEVLKNYQYALVYSFLRHIDSLHDQKFKSGL